MASNTFIRVTVNGATGQYAQITHNNMHPNIIYKIHTHIWRAAHMGHTKHMNMNTGQARTHHLLDKIVQICSADVSLINVGG